MIGDRLTYFGLTAEPFSLTADARLIFPSQTFRAGWAQIKVCIDRKIGGLLTVSGEVGMGKTTLCNLLTAELEEAMFCTRALNPQSSPSETLETLRSQLGAARATVEAIQTQAVKRSGVSGQPVGLLVFEEAQNLSAEMLNLILALCNLEVHERKLFFVVLCGQPELHALLAQTEYRQLSQRVISQIRLTALNREETQDYIRHRLNQAGSHHEPFSKAAVHRIFAVTQGNPRLINTLCDESLSWLHANGKKHLSGGNVSQVLKQSTATGRFKRPANTKHRPLLGRAVILVGVCALGALIGLSALTPFGARIDDRIGDWSVVQLAAWQEILDAGFDRTATSVDSVTDDTVVVAAQMAAEDALAARWRDYGYAVNGRPFCDNAVTIGLRCDQLVSVEWDAILGLDRPFIMHSTDALARAIVARSDNALIASNGVRIDRTAWDTSEIVRIEFAWAPPPDMVSLNQVEVGDYRPKLVRWLNEGLRSVSGIDGNVITGGVFTDYHRNMIRQFQQTQSLAITGRLDRAMILRLNAAAERVPTLSLGSKKPN